MGERLKINQNNQINKKNQTMTTSRENFQRTLSSRAEKTSLLMTKKLKQERERQEQPS